MIKVMIDSTLLLVVGSAQLVRRALSLDLIDCLRLVGGKL
jgi:hypothetical protein